MPAQAHSEIESQKDKQTKKQEEKVTIIKTG